MAETQQTCKDNFNNHGKQRKINTSKHKQLNYETILLISRLAQTKTVAKQTPFSRNKPTNWITKHKQLLQEENKTPKIQEHEKEKKTLKSPNPREKQN